MSTAPSVWKDYVDQGRKALEEGRAADACAELTLGLHIAEGFEPGDARLLETLNYLGYALHKQGDNGGAEAIFRRALTLRQEALNPDHADIAENLHWLATVCRRQRKDDEAEALTLRELEAWKKALGPAPAPMASSLDNRTHCYWFRLAVRERALGPEHPEISYCLNQLAYVLWSAYDGDDRELFWRQAAEILQRLYQRPDRSEHWQVVGSLHRTLANLACLAYRRDQHDEAERLMRQMYEIVQEGYGPKSAAANSALSDLPTFPRALLEQFLGKSHAGVGNYAEAEPWFQRAITDCEKDLPRLNGLLSDTLRGYADLCRKTGREEKANQLEQRARTA